MKRIELAQHRGLGVQLDERELDRLVARQRLAPRDALVRVRDRLVDAELRGAERRRGLADPVLVHEVLRELEPAVERPEHGDGRNAHVAHASPPRGRSAC